MRQSRIRAVIEASVVIFVGALTLSTFGCAGRDDPPPAGDGGMRAGDGSLRCLSSDECNDAIDCTVDVCNVAGVCEHSPLDALCEAGESCSATVGCRAGGSCATVADCDDTIACTFDSCGVGGICNHMPLDRLCTNAGETCNLTMGCQRTGCSTAADCNDNVDCTVDMCAVGNVCMNTPVNSLCTGAGEMCAATGCYVPMPCDAATDCDDGNFCNGEEVCEPEFGCQPPIGPTDCNDRDPCTTESCDVVSDTCVFVCDDVATTCPMCPEAPIDYNGTFSIVPPPTQTCAFGAVNYNISSMRFTFAGGILAVMAGTFTLTQPGPSSTTGPMAGAFDVSAEITGACNEIYRLQGTFTDADHFTGTWTSMFVDDDGISCLGCAGITVAVTGTRTP